MAAQQATSETNPPNAVLATKFADAFAQVPAVVRHYENVTEDEVDGRLRGEINFRNIVREKINNRWFAALVSTEAKTRFRITERFSSLQEFFDFVSRHHAVVEVAAYSDDTAHDGKGRRISATELADIKRGRHEQPLLVSLVFKDDNGGGLRNERVEFGFNAAADVLAMNEAYDRHRHLQLTAHEILRCRDEHGALDAQAQWDALNSEVKAERASIVEMPLRPLTSKDLFVAFEIEVDKFGNFTRLIRAYRESEVRRRIVSDADHHSVQVLGLRRVGASEAVASGFRVQGTEGELESVPYPVTGQDVVELRVKDDSEPNPRLWHVLEFGEAEVLQQSALAKFGLVSAYLEGQRKQLALRRTRLDLFAEPVFAGLSIGGGLSGIGFPIGEAARLAYNVTIGPHFIPEVPTVKEFRELFILIVAKDKHPVLRTKPEEFLTEVDIRELRAAMKNVTDAEADAYMQRIADTDLRAMQKLAKWQNIDAKYTLLANILIGVAKVSGVSESGLAKTILNNSVVTITGDVSVKTILALMMGHRIATPLSGISLETLAKGDGPSAAWLQFFDVSVDLRAVLNSVNRLFQKGERDRELRKPFPYAPGVTELAAYEFRIFGYPLLMYYKRGLLKDDLAAYEKDYAYGIVGTHIVEHFPSKESMLDEIRAGRLAPLGFVRVGDGKGGVVDSRLVVYAHHLAEGKYKGQTAIIIYGLQAYLDHAVGTEQEVERFREYERTLIEGGVIEKLVRAESPAGIPSIEFAPKIRKGAVACADYAALLGGLRELERYWQLRKWGAPVSQDDEQRIDELGIQLRALGIRTDDPADTPFLGADRFNSSFIYKTYVSGRWREVKLTLIPSVTDIDRELKKAEESQQLESLRRRSVSPQGDGIVLLNEVLERAGRMEIGPPLRDGKGEILGAGVHVDADDIGGVFAQLIQLPITNQARLLMNNFAATPVVLDVAGEKKRVFLTVEFPVDGSLQSQQINPLSGEREISYYNNGRRTGVVSDRRVVELGYDETGLEQRTVVHLNMGTRSEPVKGPLLEETKTIEAWFRRTPSDEVDPTSIRLAKLHVNHITGQSTRESFGSFPQPIEVADGLYLTRNRFDAYGLLESATVTENGKEESDFQRAELDRVLHPISGRQRFDLTVNTPRDSTSSLSKLRARGFRMEVEQVDLLKKLHVTHVFDLANFGLRLETRWIDGWEGTNRFERSTRFYYRDDFAFGMLPKLSFTHSEPSGALLSEVETAVYDPLTRQLTANENDYTGKRTRKTWDARWQGPLRVESDLRATSYNYNRAETEISGSTHALVGGERLSEFSGRFDGNTLTWVFAQTNLFRPGVPSRIGTETRSGFGTLISATVANLLEARPSYDFDGRETGSIVRRRNSVTSQFDIIHRQEDHYGWHSGWRDAEVQTFVDGQPHDVFRIVTDPEGRTVSDGIKSLQALELKTSISFDGGSDRPVKAELSQGGSLRLTREYLPEARQSNGDWLIPVKVVPFWGLTSTQFVRLDDPLARMQETQFENGDRLKVLEWFEGTGVAKTSELLDRRGQPKERFTIEVRAGEENGLPYDLLRRDKLNRWGGSGLAEEKAVLRGTDISFFKRTIDEKTYYDVSKVFDTPLYAVDPHGQDGVTVSIGGNPRKHVLMLYRGSFLNWPMSGQSSKTPEPLLQLQGVDLRGLFFYKFSKVSFDRVGNVLDEVIGKIRSPGQHGYLDQSIFDAVDRAGVGKRFRYSYAPGWWVERPDRKPGNRILSFSATPPGDITSALAVNDSPWREIATSITGQQADSPDELFATNRTPYFFRTISNRCELELNPYLPDQKDNWTSWTATEMAADGSKLFDAETVFDAQGRVRVMQSHKLNSAGILGTKTVYSIANPPKDALLDHQLVLGRTSLALSMSTQTDFSGSDFIYFYANNPDRAPFSLVARDAGGRDVVVYRRDSEDRQDGLLTWAIENANIRWVPDMVIPEKGSLINAPASLAKTGRVVAISVHDLAQAGLDIRRMASIDVKVNGRAGGRFGVSPLFHLARGGKFVPDSESFKFSYSEEIHSSGFKTFTKTRKKRTEAEALDGLFQNSVIELNGRPVAFGHTRSRNALFPVIVVTDNSDPDSSAALYALHGSDGSFLEFYKTLKRGDSQVYSVVSGFEIPRVDVTRASILDDEISPGYLAYGQDYLVRSEIAKGRGWLSGALANFHNRISANAFKYGADQFLKEGDAKTKLENRFNQLHNASGQAEAISALPMLGEALLAHREVPWKTGSIAQSEGWVPDRASLKSRLLTLHGAHKTGLLATSPDTASELFVDTVKEAALIELALELKESGMARELLNFYWEKSAGGSTPLHASYHAQSGAALRKNPHIKRAQGAPPTAEAQLAIAEAAIRFGVEEENHDREFTLGKNLTSTLLDRFWQPGGGISESPLIAQTNKAGFTLWPEPSRFTLRSNARGYLLLRNLTNVMSRYEMSSEWGLRVRDVLRQQHAWLMTNIVRQVERTGVAPRGLFQIQDIYEQTTAMGVDRWTAAEDWMVFLEAADAMGLPRVLTQRWLENLALVHGVSVDGKWGLDWSLPLVRPDAISSELTAKFWRTARLLEHVEALKFASHQLSLMRQSQGFPVVVTRGHADKPLESGQGFPIETHKDRNAWPTTLAPFAELLSTPWDFSKKHELATVRVVPRSDYSFKDTSLWLLCAGAFYAAVIASNFFWWTLRFWRRRHRKSVVAGLTAEALVPASVMLRSEERWAKRVLGMRIPSGAEKTRFSNATVEVNFHMQLRAIYKLVLEWRRLTNGWEEKDARLVEGDADGWLNGLDEFASLVGIYMRWVIKAGFKDGFPHADVLAEQEDGNHIWSRLLMYLSEYYWAMLSALDHFNKAGTQEAKSAANREIELLLNDMGLRERRESFDARDAFNFPANPSAFDLLNLQKPGMTLARVVDELEAKLKTPRRHFTRLIANYKSFKRRENTDPLHPYLIEAAKILPHFLLMGFGALVWYNEKRVGDEPLFGYIWDKLILQSTQNFLSWPVLAWALPLLLGSACSLCGHWVRTYRWQSSMQLRAQSEVWLYQTMTSFFTRKTSLLPEARTQWWWNPLVFERAGWFLRSLGFLVLGFLLLWMETPNFVTFLLVKGILAMLAFTEVGSILLPFAATLFSKFLQDRIVFRPETGRILRFLNSLNITATRPASILWQSFRYHFQATAPSGTIIGTVQTILFYLLQAFVFFFVGIYLCQEMLPLWFTEKYLSESNWKLFFGGLIFWNTLYLLRYGLFLLATGIGSLLATFPLRTIGATVALTQIAAVLLGWITTFDIGPRALPGTALLLAGLALMMFEERVLKWVAKVFARQTRAKRLAVENQLKFDLIKQERTATLGIIYMSGDDLCCQKLTPSLLMTRWRILRDKLDSETIHWLFGMAGRPSDAELEARFHALYEAEKQSDVTLWHPIQLCVAGEPETIPAELQVNIPVPSHELRAQLLQTWHTRRWLVTMMSTAGHSQDTAINLVDIALRLEKDGLAPSVAFYLIQNKYDNNDNNRPSQLLYDKGELGHRNKLARLLCAVAPGARAYSLQNWTPFGFKAGGLTGMDLAYEETMRLSTVLLLDRNATVNDLDALMIDLACAITDPGVVIVIPGRGTTNTLTPLGQASQLVEEGHRSFAKGLMETMGGTGSEAVGTGWGNILAVYYGRVQRAMVDIKTPKRPMTSRMRRGSSFGVQLEGLIGFSPHAVGISEDTWSVSQTAHNALALGHRVKFLHSHAMWHKIRETWSHTEWLSAFPRWSGGFVQMMHDPVMQEINDFGPLSIFAKEVRANSGRYFLTALFALASILLMPFAIIWDVAPFVQILIVLWNFGFIMNQVLTMHGLQTYLEGAGFRRAPALVGAAAAGMICLRFTQLQSIAAGAIILGFLCGGFIVGLGRWLYYRLRDVILFGPQLVLHALGQLMRQSLEFVASGASPEDAKGVNMAFRTWSGPREDRPHEEFPNIFNFRTVVWFVGGASLLAHVLALGSLDMFNVLLLLPSLLFSVSTFIGPFLTKPKAGDSLGWRVVFPKALAWGGCFVTYTLVSWLVAQGGWLKAMGITMLTCLFGFMLTRALRYLGFHGKLRRFQHLLAGRLQGAGVAIADAVPLARLIIEQNANAASKVQAALTQAGASSSDAGSILEFVEETVRPFLRSPLTDMTQGRFVNNRFVSEFSASFLLAMFTLGMFYVVPVPGLFVFAAHNYHFSLGIGTVLSIVGCLICISFVGLWVGRLVEWFDRHGISGGGLRQRTENTYLQFQALSQNGRKLTPLEVSSVYAGFTDVQTYIDQRSYAYARRTLVQIDAVLDVAKLR